MAKKDSDEEIQRIADQTAAKVAALSSVEEEVEVTITEVPAGAPADDHPEWDSPPNDQQTEEPGVSAAVSAAVSSGLGNLPSNEPEEDDG